jgi:preprotein translocase subunit SecE
MAEATAEKKPRTNPIQFIQQVRAEAKKITWTTRQETTLSTIMVFVMVVIAGIFFFFTDLAIRSLISWLLSFAS